MLKTVSAAEIEELDDDSMLFGYEKTKLLDVAEIFIVSLMIAFIVFFYLRPMVNRLLAKKKFRGNKVLYDIDERTGLCFSVYSPEDLSIENFSYTCVPCTEEVLKHVDQEKLKAMREKDIQTCL